MLIWTSTKASRVEIPAEILRWKDYVWFKLNTEIVEKMKFDIIRFEGRCEPALNYEVFKLVRGEIVGVDNFDPA